MPPPPIPPGGDDSGAGDGSGEGPFEPSFQMSTAHLGMWIFLITIVILFLALVAAYVFLRFSPDWRRIEVPMTLWFNTALLLTSSWTIEMAKKSIARDRLLDFERWLTATLLLGGVFILGQGVAWMQMLASGIEPRTTLHSTFLYILTATHGLHLLGGVGALTFLLVRATKGFYSSTDHEPVRVCSLYWHSMDAIWIGLFALLLLV